MTNKHDILRLFILQHGGFCEPNHVLLVDDHALPYKTFEVRTRPFNVRKQLMKSHDIGLGKVKPHSELADQMSRRIFHHENITLPMSVYLANTYVDRIREAARDLESLIKATLDPNSHHRLVFRQLREVNSPGFWTDHGMFRIFPNFVRGDVCAKIQTECVILDHLPEQKGLSISHSYET